MPPECHTTSLPRPCAEKFEEISRSLGSLDRMAEDLAVLRRTVAGNGTTERSLTYRLVRLEEAADFTRGNKTRWAERVWRLCVALGLVVFGWWLRS